MIQLSIKESIDNEKVGLFKFSKNLIYIGKDPGCDLYLDEHALNSNHIFIEINESKLLCHLGKSTDFILVNKKRTTGHKFLKIGDQIKISSTIFQIDSFHKTDSISYKEMLNKGTEEILLEDKDLLQILKETQKSTSI